LAYKNEGVFSGWFYITDLFVDDGFRHEGLGSQLIGELERELIKIGIHSMWTWTAGYEAPSFYQKLGYSVFAQLENYYSDGSSKIAFRKKL
jgi:ribosomal protein S18 acetylase RimI-like enzyme